MCIIKNIFVDLITIEIVAGLLVTNERTVLHFPGVTECSFACLLEGVSFPQRILFYTIHDHQKLDIWYFHDIIGYFFM